MIGLLCILFTWSHKSLIGVWFFSLPQYSLQYYLLIDFWNFLVQAICFWLLQNFQQGYLVCNYSSILYGVIIPRWRTFTYGELVHHKAFSNSFTIIVIILKIVWINFSYRIEMKYRSFERIRQYSWNLAGDCNG